MPAEEEYELLPHEEVEQLRKDVNRLKKNPFGEGKDSQDLIASINDLKNAVQTLHALFAQANQEMVHDYHATSIKEHFNILSQQNSHIAEGIVSVAKLLEQQAEAIQPASPVQASEPMAPLPENPVPTYNAMSQPMPQQPPVQQPIPTPRPILPPAQPMPSPSQQMMPPPPMPPPVTSVAPDPSTVLPGTSGFVSANPRDPAAQLRASQEAQEAIGAPITNPPQSAPQQMVIPPLPPPVKKRGLFK